MSLFVKLSQVVSLCRRPSRRRLLIWAVSWALLSGSSLSARAQPPQESVDTPVTMTGTLHIVHGDDFDHHRSRFFYWLEDERTGARHEMFFAGIPTHGLRSGARIRVHGKARGREVLVAAADGGSVETVAAAAAPAVSGTQNTLVLMANFRDASVSCSASSIEQTMFTSIDDFYQETSFGQLSFSGEVFGPTTIAYDTTSTCDYYAWSSAAEAAAQASGINLSQYPRRVYVLPQQNSCGYIGLGSVGGNPSRSWIFRCDLQDVFGHELGHNLSAHHAANAASEYGDTSDIMGYSGVGLRHMNAPHKEQLGWLSGAQVQTVTQDGTYTLAPLELHPVDTLAPQVLKIAKPDTNEYYYLSYRRPLGFDAGLASTYRERVNVHRYPGSGAVFTHFLQALTDGGSFADAGNGLTVTQVSHDDSTATVQVSFVCQAAPPVASLSPGSQSSQPGETVNYTLSISSQDSASCPAATLALTPSVPAGWSGTLTPSTLTLTPTATSTATLAVSAPVSASSGAHTVEVGVFDSQEAVHSVSAQATTMVAVADDTAPSAPGNLQATLQRRRVQLTWGAATDNVEVTGYHIWRNGVQMATVTGTSYTDNSTQKRKTYTYSVVATDQAGNLSAQSNTATITR